MDVFAHHLTVKTFDNITGDTAKECNDFLKTIPKDSIIDVKVTFNTLLGGVIYTVLYSK